MLESAGIISIHNDHNGRVIGKLTYGNVSATTGCPGAVRLYREDYIELNQEILSLADRLLESYPYYDKPYPEDEIEKKFNSAIVVEMYSFYPSELFDELGMNAEADRAISTMLQIASDVNCYSQEETASGAKFEYALTEAFNTF